jgi:alginate O-acetyltransferase complex protein AlgI
VSFTSPLFFVALVPAVAALYLLPGRWRAIYLLALSYAFYALSSRIYLVLLIVASAGIYALGIAIAKSGSERAKQAYMAAGVAAVMAVIMAFKAAGAWRGLLLPLGASFYSFKLISYLVEVYWDDEAVERDPVVFFLFPAFFRRLSAVRSSGRSLSSPRCAPSWRDRSTSSRWKPVCGSYWAG